MGGSKMNKPTPETDFAEYYIQGEGNYVRSDISRKLERERGEANTKLQEVSSKLADALSERDEAREEAAHWKTEYGIVVARLCGRKHPRDNGIIFEHEVIPRLKELVYAWESRWKAEVEFAAKERELRKKAERERDEARELAKEARELAKEARELAKEADLGHDMAISDLTKCETELAEATTKLAEISSLTESIVEKANELIDRWDQPSWKDTAPTARFINALRIAVRAYEREAK
jgi:uncharacterized coiled-coil DUF342 family protein